ncbi:hypothetical protein IFR05_013302 [Cadophora sp. M221]|nr:hypothetical protein IFR05_013302 [Cadophora sp. M221]
MAIQSPANATGSEQQRLTSNSSTNTATATATSTSFPYKKHVLQDKYNFETAFYRIPSQNPESHFLEKFQEIKEESEMEESLVIVYYGGHGGVDKEEGKHSFKVGPLGLDNSMYWSPPQYQGQPPSAPAQFSPDGSSRRIDIITACGGYDGTTPAPGKPTYGNRLGCAFTEILTHVLEKKADAKETFTAANLHVSIMQRMMEVKLVTGNSPPTPFHFSVGAMNGLPSPSVLLKVMGEQNATT